MEEKIRIDGEKNVSPGDSIPRPSIDESWERCSQYGLDGINGPKVFKVSNQRIEQLLDRYKDVISAADPYIKGLTLALPKNESIIGLASDEGVLLKVRDNVNGIMNLGFQRGFVHQEMYMGTNAIGMCIETKSRAMVWGEEHFFKALGDWVGFAAPINMDDNPLGAIIFAMVPVGLAYRGFLEVISMAAHGIDMQLRLAHDNKRLVNLQLTTQNGRDDILEASSIVSHEVKNSLANISAYIQLLQLDRAITNISGRKILNEISRVTRMLDDFKLLSGHKYDTTQVHPLSGILQLVIDVMASKAQLNDVDIIFDSPDESIHIKADKNSLQQVFINLIDNAIDSMKDGGTLTIGLQTESSPNMAIISFKDTGSGIPPDEIPNIFKIYQTTKVSGSGLGLHICQTIVRFYGGSIGVESTLGEGTTFVVKLPEVFDK
ncbi:MAG TPA: ATP-binding protein [Clostridia bacterium]|nr:ATP-binding protein [Clostridia bacterium]